MSTVSRTRRLRTRGTGARVDVTFVRPGRPTLTDRRVEIVQFVDGEGLEFPPGTVMLRLVSGFGPLATVHERRAALPGADLTSAIAAAKGMLA